MSGPLRETLERCRGLVRHELAIRPDEAAASGEQLLGDIEEALADLPRSAMTIPYELYCRWIQTVDGHDGPTVSAARSGEIPFVPCKGFSFQPWPGVLPVQVEHVEWSCDGNQLIIEAEYRDRADYLGELIKALKEKGVSYTTQDI